MLILLCHGAIICHHIIQAKQFSDLPYNADAKKKKSAEDSKSLASTPSQKADTLASKSPKASGSQQIHKIPIVANGSGKVNGKGIFPDA